jgi:hypothetical protein
LRGAFRKLTMYLCSGTAEPQILACEPLRPMGATRSSTRHGSYAMDVRVASGEESNVPTTFGVSAKWTIFVVRLAHWRRTSTHGPTAAKSSWRRAWSMAKRTNGPRGPNAHVSALSIRPQWLANVLAQLKPAPISTPATLASYSLPSPDLERQAIAYVEAMPAAIQGQNRSGACYAAAVALVHTKNSIRAVSTHDREPLRQ